jgi:hypothetical protein
VSVVGVKLKLSILTSTLGGPAAIDFSAPESVTSTITIDAAKQGIHLLFFISSSLKYLRDFPRYSITAYSKVESINARL